MDLVELVPVVRQAHPGKMLNMVELLVGALLRWVQLEGIVPSVELEAAVLEGSIAVLLPWQVQLVALLEIRSVLLV